MSHRHSEGQKSDESDIQRAINPKVSFLQRAGLFFSHRMKSWLRNRRHRDRRIDTSPPNKSTPSPVDVVSPTTIGSVDHAELAEHWAKQTEESVLHCSASRSLDYRAKAEEELAAIQRKAKQLEQMMVQYQATHGAPKDSPMSPMHDPKHIGEAISTNIAQTQEDHIGKSGRSRSISDVTNQSTNIPVLRTFKPQPYQQENPRRTKSSSALHADAHSVPPRTRDGTIPNPDVPYQCIYCKRTYETLASAEELHPVCTMWSCTFLPGIQYAIYPIETAGELKALCCYCNASLGQGQEGRVKSAVLKGHMRQHKFRNCEHKLYYSGQSFRQHLHDVHRTIYDGSLLAAWTLLFKSCQRTQPAIFERAETVSGARRSNTDPIVSGSKKSGVNKRAIPSNFMELTETSIIEPNKLRRKRSAATLPGRHHQDMSASTLSLPRPSTMETATQTPIPPLPQDVFPRKTPSMDSIVTATASLIGNTAGSRLAFYRRRIDASTRNQIYLQSLDEPMSTEYSRHFRKVSPSIFGGLILHSSLTAAVPARMTNSVDLYPLH